MSIVLTNKRTKIGTAFDVNTTVENKYIESIIHIMYVRQQQKHNGQNRNLKRNFKIEM